MVVRSWLVQYLHDYIVDPGFTYGSLETFESSTPCSRTCLFCNRQFSHWDLTRWQRIFVDKADGSTCTILLSPPFPFPLPHTCTCRNQGSKSPSNSFLLLSVLGSFETINRESFFWPEKGWGIVVGCFAWLSRKPLGQKNNTKRGTIWSRSLNPWVRRHALVSSILFDVAEFERLNMVFFGFRGPWF